MSCKPLTVEEFIEICEGHYWDSLEENKDIIMLHLKAMRDKWLPESKKCEENRADEINKLCDSAFGVGKREEKCQKEYFPVPKLPDFSGIPPIVMPCQCYAEITHLGYGCPCKCHLKEEYKCKTCGGDAFSCKGCQDSKEGWCACGEPKKEGFEYHSTDECKKCDDSIYNASAFTHDPSDCSSCLHGESAKKLREETHTVEPQPRDSYIREGLECICIGKCHCKPKEKKFYSGWGSLAEDFKIEESIPFVPETLIFNSACPATPENIAKARKICGVEESKPECDGIDPTKIVRNQYGHINIKATADACRKPKDAEPEWDEKKIMKDIKDSSHAIFGGEEPECEHDYCTKKEVLCRLDRLQDTMNQAINDDQDRQEREEKAFRTAILDYLETREGRFKGHSFDINALRKKFL